MKIALAGTYPPGVLEAFQSHLPRARFDIIPIDTTEKYDTLNDAECIILRVFKAPREVIERNKNLRMICRWGAGFDTVDIEAASKQGVLVTNTPGANAYSVSELAVLLMIAVGRNLLPHTRNIESGVWDRTAFLERAVTLNNKTVGLIGGGNIGRQVSEKVRTFGARVQYYDPYRLSPQEEARWGMEYAEFDKLISTSDVISLHIPLTKENRHIIGRKQFSSMKEGAILINTARGGLVDDKALAEAIAQGHLAGAGLDCVEFEPLRADDPLVVDPRIVITPHIGGATTDIADVMVPMIAGNIMALDEGKMVSAVVNSYILENSPVI